MVPQWRERQRDLVPSSKVHRFAQIVLRVHAPKHKYAMRAAVPAPRFIGCPTNDWVPNPSLERDEIAAIFTRWGIVRHRTMGLASLAANPA